MPASKTSNDKAQTPDMDPNSSTEAMAPAGLDDLTKKINQVIKRADDHERQIGHQSEALYAITKYLTQKGDDDSDVQTARAHVNALNPDVYTFKVDSAQPPPKG